MMIFLISAILALATNLYIYRLGYARGVYESAVEKTLKETVDEAGE